MLLSPGQLCVFFSRSRRAAGLLAVCLLAAMTVAVPAGALVRLDFEQRYFVHPGVQTWDFSLVRDQGVYHIFYTAVFESNSHASNADSLRHATSTDLKLWTLEEPVLAVGQGPWDSGALWAPDVFRDEANNRWAMAYTGCDNQLNQRTCMAFSDDLFTWTKSAANPVVVPDTNQYVWDPNGSWSDFRDPFIYRQDNQWHMLVTAKKWLGVNTGVLFHGTSTDLENWQDVGYLFDNDGFDKWRVLESSQYHVFGDYHHLLFGEFDTPGVTLITNDNPADWTMAERILLDYGYAPEINEFDPGHRIFSRLAPYYRPDGVNLSYVVRLDTLLTELDGSQLVVHKPHPLDDDWAVHTGTANLGNPVFGDNPVWRGEPSVGLVGNSYYSSKEYYNGPLSGRGGPGTQLGDGVTGILESHPFVVTGHRMSLLVGGGNFPATCYVALVSTADSTVLYSETGQDSNLMSLREWDLVPHQGLECVIRIVDTEASPMGHINVDEIVEYEDFDPPASPTTVVAAYRAEGVDLDWDDAPETDFQSHRIYRSADPDFVPAAGNLLEEIAVSAWTDSTSNPWDYYYKITTVDLVGNESPPGVPSGVSGAPLPDLPAGIRLAEAVPNPFNPSTRLGFEIAEAGPVRLRIFDPAGRLVAVLVDESLAAGTHEAVWNGRDSRGRMASAGVYLYQLEAGGSATTRRMTLIK
ncbi:MAG: FlgD immunoglobulin-like domain containing protein [Candidatus Krumholzibacteriota bacterium]